MKIKPEDINKLSDILDQNNLSEIEYSDENYKIKIARNIQVVEAASTVQVDKNVGSAEITNENIEIIKCPLVGHFYLSPSPGEKPFIKKGDSIKKGDVIGIVQAMKVSNEIKSEYDGIVEEIMLENEEFVDCDSDIIKVRLHG